MIIMNGVCVFTQKEESFSKYFFTVTLHSSGKFCNMIWYFTWYDLIYFWYTLWNVIHLSLYLFFDPLVLASLLDFVFSLNSSSVQPSSYTNCLHICSNTRFTKILYHQHVIHLKPIFSSLFPVFWNASKASATLYKNIVCGCKK